MPSKLTEDGSGIEVKLAKYYAGQHKACHLKFIQTKLEWSNNSNKVIKKSVYLHQ